MEALTAAIKINIHHVCPPLNGVLSVMGCSWSHTLLAHSEWAQEMLVWVDGWKKFPANSFSYKAHPWGITSTCFSNSSKQTGGLSVQFNSVTRLCPTLWDPMDCSMPGLPVHRQIPEFTQDHQGSPIYIAAFNSQLILGYSVQIEGESWEVIWISTTG